MKQKITSLTHPLVKHWVELRKNKEARQMCKTALLSGINLIGDLAASHAFKAVIVEEGYEPPFALRCERAYVCTAEILKKITGLAEPQPLAAEIALPPEQELKDTRFLLILDGIADPGNLGTLLRTALALGWEGVFLTPGSCDPFNEKALRAAKGATFKIPIQQSSWPVLEALLATRLLLAADVLGKPLSTVRAQPPLALALGNEAKGISPQILSKAKHIAIPMHSGMESLNVACAGAILMYEIRELHV
jgi:TrmH family RNA methyltransferase